MKTLNLTTIATIAIAGVSFFSKFTTGHFLVAGLEAFRGIGVLLFWLYAHRTKNVGMGVVGVIYVSWLGFTGLLIASGGIGSLHLYWLVTLPAFALMLVSRRLAITLAIGTAITVIAIVSYSGSGDLISYASPEGGRRGYSAILAMAVLMLVSHMTMGWRDDLSRALEKENAARQSEHLKKNSFFVHMNHEIRNPLTALVASIDMLQIDDANIKSKGLSNAEVTLIEKRRMELITSIKKTSEHIVSIVNDVLEIDRLDISTEAEQQSLFSIRTLGKDIYDITSARASAAGSNIVLAFMPGLNEMWVGCDSRIKQVLLNLVSNALQHSGSKKIVVSFSESANGINIQVKDNGKGMTKEALERIFDPYSSSVIGFGSSGLGVGICKLLVEKKMGGSISVESQVGSGTVFSVSIPLIRYETKESVESNKTTAHFQNSEVNSENPKLDGLTLLIVDDDEDCGQAMQMVLETYGLEVQIAKTSQEALEITSSKTDFDAILVDHNLGPKSVVDGIALTKQLVAQGVTRVIGFTGNYSTVVHAQWKQAGVNSIIQKPITAKALLEEISVLVDQSIQIGYSVNSNVVKLVIPARKELMFVMPSLNGVTSNAMTYTTTLQRLDTDRFESLFAKTFGVFDANVDWSTLDFEKVQVFLRTWYGDAELQLIKVVAFADDEVEESGGELYFFQEKKASNSMYSN